jgi:hypothetical protein
LEVAPTFLSVDAVLATFGEGDVETLRGRYVSWVLGETQDPALEDRIRSNDRVLGDRSFKERIAEIEKAELMQQRRIVLPVDTDVTDPGPS